jgi:hypothetical protein
MNATARGYEMITIALQIADSLGHWHNLNTRKCYAGRDAVAEARAELEALRDAWHAARCFDDSTRLRVAEIAGSRDLLTPTAPTLVQSGEGAQPGNAFMGAT